MIATLAFGMCSSIAGAQELIDAPGRGYREQAGKLNPGGLEGPFLFQRSEEKVLMRMVSPVVWQRAIERFVPPKFRRPDEDPARHFLDRPAFDPSLLEQAPAIEKFDTPIRLRL
jgi:hypothetical protein